MAGSVPCVIKAGTVTAPDGETWTHYAVFYRSTVDAAISGDWSRENDWEVAQELTGWSRYSRGPGRAFGEDPRMRTYGRKVIVIQRCGLDV